MLFIVFTREDILTLASSKKVFCYSCAFFPSDRIKKRNLTLGQFYVSHFLWHTHTCRAYSTVEVRTPPPISREMLFKDIYIITSCLIPESRVRACSTPSWILDLVLYHLQLISQKPLSGDCNLQWQNRCWSDRITGPLNFDMYKGQE